MSNSTRCYILRPRPGVNLPVRIFEGASHPSQPMARVAESLYTCTPMSHSDFSESLRMGRTMEHVKPPPADAPPAQPPLPLGNILSYLGNDLIPVGEATPLPPIVFPVLENVVPEGELPASISGLQG